MEGASNNARTPAQNPTIRNAKALVAEFRCPTTLALTILAEFPRYVLLLANQSLERAVDLQVRRLKEVAEFEHAILVSDGSADFGERVCNRLRKWPDVGEVVVLAEGLIALKCVPSVVVASAPPWGYRTALAWLTEDGSAIHRCSFDRGMMVDELTQILQLTCS